MSGARFGHLFLDMLAAERGAARNTIEAYRRDLDDYFAHLAETGIGPDGADAASIRSFMASLAERGLKASSAARRLSAVRQFHKFLYVEGYAATDPTAAVVAPKRSPALPKVLGFTMECGHDFQPEWSEAEDVIREVSASLARFAADVSQQVAAVREPAA